MASVDPAVVDEPSRHARGAWATPPALVEHILDHTLDHVLAERSSPSGLVVLDPACGDGRFLVAATRRIATRFGVDAARAARCCVGIEVDAATGAATRRALPGAEIIVGDALAGAWTGEADVVVGNPPYLTPLRRRSGGVAAPAGSGPYADAAARFLCLAVNHARGRGARIGLVLPASLLAVRDGAEARAATLRRARLTTLWWAGEDVFDAAVDTCIATFVTGKPQGAVACWRGPAFIRLADEPAGDLGDRPGWGHLLRQAAGIPPVALHGDGPTLADLATASADFRDEYYGLAGAVSDDAEGPPLVTAGSIDVGSSRWGTRPTRFHRRRFEAPRVRIDALSPRMRSWAARRLVPKVLVATQTRVIEAVVDAGGEWLPSVPVISVVPRHTDDLWRVAAVLTAPPVAAHAAATYLGAGLSGSAIKLSAQQVAGLPVPARAWDEAARALEAGDPLGCAAAMCDAYGEDREPLLTWWRAGARL